MCWADLLADTMHLSRADFGSYVFLLARYYHSERGPLPDDDESLRITARCDAQDWPRCKALLAALFHVEQGFWRHKRADKEMQEAYDTVMANRERAAAGLAEIARGRGRNWNGRLGEAALPSGIRGEVRHAAPLATVGATVADIATKTVAETVAETVTIPKSVVRSQKSDPRHFGLSISGENRTLLVGTAVPGLEMNKLKCPSEENPGKQTLQSVDNPPVGQLMQRALMLFGKENLMQGGSRISLLCRQNPGKFQRILADIEQMDREGRLPDNPGAYFVTLWKEFA